MRFIAPLASISAVSAFVISKDVPAILLADKAQQVETLMEHVQKGVSSSVEKTADFVSSGAERISIEFDKALSTASRLGDKITSFEHEITTSEIDLSNYTIFEIISESNYTTKFASYLKDHQDVIDILNKTDASNTLFVPINEAFEHLPKHGKLSDGYVEQGLRYHIGLGDQHAGLFFPEHTIPTAYNEEWLGDKPQRLRLSAGLHGISVNYYSKVVAANFKAKNGYIHAVNKKHLKALLKYQIVPNVTVYSDEVYYSDKRVAIEDLTKDGHFHIQLPTLLEKDISVDIYTWKLWTSMVLNGAVKVDFIDAIAKNGVAHVIDDIVVPNGKVGDKTEGEIEVEELKYRLGDYVDSEEEAGEL